ncbi:NADPH-dependent codeinone reductase 1-2 [Vitis vinifera]|uniref:NADPH-dependent codeinone reductase 1-2 n=1 Tax=Vitis vinifera TaxID=29760 RepID=A0A438FK16_VITVI|nr:NADPH-dependent codeinone reductase 1-2 [Vitis vinifera]
MWKWKERETKREGKGERGGCRPEGTVSGSWPCSGDDADSNSSGVVEKGKEKERNREPREGEEKLHVGESCAAVDDDVSKVAADFGGMERREETMKESILHAIKLGYRHIDAAAIYNSEPPVGEAIAEALGLGLIKSRAELFITSKLWCTDAHPDLVLPALRRTLKNLGLEYLDLYLIHFPVSLKPGSCEVPFEEKDLLPLDFKSVWEAMEECQSLGLSK